MPDDDWNDEVVANVLGYFAERVNLVFSYFYCTFEFETDEDFAANPAKNGRAWALQTIRTACLHSTLIALRDLDDVLTPRTQKSKDDDLKVSDFGYPSGHSFLGRSERTRINKMIAHATLPGSKLPAARWAIWALASKGIHQSLSFLKWAEENLDWSTALFCGTRIQKTYDYFAKIIEERRKRSGRAR